MRTSGRMRILRFATPKQDAQQKLSQIQIYPLPSGPRVGERKFGVGDLDGDGKTDVVVSDPSSATLIVFRQQKT